MPKEVKVDNSSRRFSLASDYFNGKVKWNIEKFSPDDK